MFAKYHHVVCKALLLLLPMACCLGCPRQREDDDSHDQGHTHSHGDHDMGPHDGHVVHLSDDMIAEWIHEDDTDTVTIILLGSDEKTPQSTPGAVVEIVCESESFTEPQVFTLPSKPAEEGESFPADSRFELQDGQLLTNLTIGEGVACTLKVTVEDQEHSLLLEHHDHDH